MSGYSIVKNVDTFDWSYYLVRYPEARSSMGASYFNNTGYDQSRDGFSLGRIRMLYGGNYSAYVSDALLRAAWIDGNLAAIPREPRWWHRDGPGMSMNRSAVEILCVDDGLDLVVPTDDEKTTPSAMGAVQVFSGAHENSSLSNKRTVTGSSSTARTEFNCASESRGPCTGRGCSHRT